MKAAGRYRQVPRTKHVSTTNIVSRVLAERPLHHADVGASELTKIASDLDFPISIFNTKTPDMGFVVYILSDWDLLNHAHLKLLEKCREVASLLAKGKKISIVAGLLPDSVVTLHKV